MVFVTTIINIGVNVARGLVDVCVKLTRANNGLVIPPAKVGGSMGH